MTYRSVSDDVRDIRLDAVALAACAASHDTDGMKLLMDVNRDRLALIVGSLLAIVGGMLSVYDPERREQILASWHSHAY